MTCSLRQASSRFGSFDLSAHDQTADRLPETGRLSSFLPTTTAVTSGRLGTPVTKFCTIFSGTRPYRVVVISAPRVATNDDVPSWMELIPEAENLFGPMSSFETHLLTGIRRRTALVVVDPDAVIGGVLLSRDGQPHQIHWLYVRESRRREGAGTELLKTILARWPTGDVRVVTFTATTPGGQSARKLYERFGFECRGRAQPAPDGSPRDLFLLRR